MFYPSEMVPARILMRPTDPQLQTNARLFQGIASMERTRGGVLYAVFYGGLRAERAGNYVVVARSCDDGATWEEPFLIARHDDPEMRLFDPNIWLDPLGRLWLTFSQSYTHFDGIHGVWVCVCDDPDAENPTFSAPRRIANGVMMNKPTVLRDGTWLFPTAVWPDTAELPTEYHPEVEAERRSNVLASTDMGETFAIRGGADVPNRCCDEHMVIERRDGSLWMLVRRFDGIGQAFSYDGGYTWWQEGDSQFKGPCSRFFIRRLKSGNLLMVNHVNFKERNNLTAQLSFDDGQTWTAGLLLDGRDLVSYPDGTQAEDGRIYIAYDREREGAREILMAVFREEDVVAGRPVSPDTRLRVIISKAGA